MPADSASGPQLALDNALAPYFSSNFGLNITDAGNLAATFGMLSARLHRYRVGTRVLMCGELRKAFIPDVAGAKQPLRRSDPCLCLCMELQRNGLETLDMELL